MARTGFVRMAEEYARRYRTQLDLPALRTFADLRNALVHHDYYGGRPNETPTLAMVIGNSQLVEARHR
ncbi:MAG: hypothetical protein WAW17_14370 [Rhodococcus sp. (in: high G+C Gram-positive bacteria)]|uniref:hypothetical protein n=1 Tax=Rhodococcus sp. TaxID=1831 RepID=UPI003BAE7D4A